MNDSTKSYLIGVVAGVLMASAVWFKFTKDNYKQGQIDYANNIIRYELVKQADGSSKWEEKK